MDDKQIYALASFRSCLFFLAAFALVDLLSLFQIYVFFFDGFMPIFYLLFFFPVWEFFYFAHKMEKNISGWAWGIGFFLFCGAFFDERFAFAFMYLFLLIVFIESRFHKPVRIFLILSFILGILTPVIWLILYPLSFILLKKNLSDFSKIKNQN